MHGLLLRSKVVHISGLYGGKWQLHHMMCRSGYHCEFVYSHRLMSHITFLFCNIRNILSKPQVHICLLLTVCPFLNVTFGIITHFPLINSVTLNVEFVSSCSCLLGMLLPVCVTALAFIADLPTHTCRRQKLMPSCRTLLNPDRISSSP